MKVILQQNVKKLGKAGEVVEASPGYFRNFLEPRKLAVEASAGAMKKRDEDLETIRVKAEKAHQAALDLADKIKEIASVEVKAKAGDGGKLYGKITNKEIAQALSGQLDYAIDKRDVRTDLDINALGSYRAEIRLSSEVHAELMVQVVST